MKDNGNSWPQRRKRKNGCDSMLEEICEKKNRLILCWSIGQMYGGSFREADLNI